MYIVTNGLLHSSVTKLAYLANYTNYTINISSLLCLDKYTISNEWPPNEFEDNALCTSLFDNMILFILPKYKEYVLNSDLNLVLTT